MTDGVHAIHPHGQLGANLTAFCAVLRRDHGFSAGPGEAADALRALETIGVADLDRARSALRLVLCARLEDTEVFDDAFDRFFLPAPPRGVLQHNLDARHTRPPQEPPPGTESRAVEARQPSGAEDDTGELGKGPRQQYPVADDPDDQDVQRFLRARYSAMAAADDAPEVPREGLDAMLEAAGILVRRLRLGHSRRWRAMPAGARFDFRRTMRGSLQTGGEALKPRWQGHPRRNPRIVVVVDGSRSMRESAGIMLQFAYALSQRIRRLDAFVFSTGLREVTRQLRRLGRGDALRLTDLTEAWGGGTRIGACLETLIGEYGHRCLSEHTLVLILSDGLDVGDPERLRRAMRELKRRSAGVVWLNPLVGTPGYVPSTQGMQAALPYVDLFSAASTVQDFKLLAQTVKL